MSSHAALASPVTRLARVTALQAAILAAYGLVLWLLAALMIRFGLPAGLFHGGLGLALVLITIPVDALLAGSVVRVAGLESGQMVNGVCIVSAAAMLGDAAALGFAPSVYGADATAAIAWLFFAVAVSLLWAVWFDRRGSRAMP